MIKVNLLRDTQVTGIKKDGTFATNIAEGTRIAGPSDSKNLLIKLGITLLPFIASFLFLTYMEGQKETALKALETKIVAKTQEKAALGPAIKAVDDFKKEKDHVQVQIDTIKTLSKERLRNVKALEALQNIMPEKAWLTTLKIEENKAEMDGNAVDDKVVADLMASLEENIYFANVRLIKTSEVQSKEGTVKSFSIECMMEGL